MTIDFVRAHAASIESNRALAEAAASPEFKESVALYAQFMLSDDVRSVVPRSEMFVLSTMDGADMDLGPSTDADSINLVGRYNHMYQTFIPVLWFTDNDEFRTSTIAKANESLALHHGVHAHT